MELLLGYESRPEYYSFEMAKAARKFVEQIMLVKPGEHVVITADTGSDSRVVNATAQAVYAADASPIVMWYERRPNPEMEPPPPWPRRSAKLMSGSNMLQRRPTVPLHNSGQAQMDVASHHSIEWMSTRWSGPLVALTIRR